MFCFRENVEEESVSVEVCDGRVTHTADGPGPALLGPGPPDQYLQRTPQRPGRLSGRSRHNILKVH